jgi:hypothetical protein
VTHGSDRDLVMGKVVTHVGSWTHGFADLCLVASMTRGSLAKTRLGLGGSIYFLLTLLLFLIFNVKLRVNLKFYKKVRSNKHNFITFNV